MIKTLIRKDLEYPELSYAIVGTLFDVYNNLGYGHKEKYYQKALQLAFKKAKISFREQVHASLNFEDKLIGRYILDFLIDNRIVLEIKAGERFSRQNINQLLSYLKTTKLRLGILANFTKDGVKFRRILNIN